VDVDDCLALRVAEPVKTINNKIEHPDLRELKFLQYVWGTNCVNKIYFIPLNHSNAPGTASQSSLE